METMGVAQARASFADLMRRAQDDPIAVEYRGKPHAVVVGIEQFERMLAALEELADLEDFDAALEEEGENLPWELAKADLGWV